MCIHLVKNLVLSQIESAPNFRDLDPELPAIQPSIYPSIRCCRVSPSDVLSIKSSPTYHTLLPSADILCVI